MRELVAFANLKGGAVLIGVEDDGSVSGISRPKLEDWVMTACRDKIRPEIIPYFEVVREVEPGKDVAVVRVDPGWAVHAVWHDAKHTYLIRVGSQSRDASPTELERLFQQRGNFRLETRPVSGSSLDDLDRRRLRDYFERVRQQAVPDDEDGSGWMTLLSNAELLSDESESMPPTVAGLLLFGERPNRFLPQAGIDAVSYVGIEKDYAARERVELRGPLTPLMSRLDSSLEPQLVETGLVEQAVEFVRRNTDVTASLIDGVRRQERRTYPEEAVREALVNALVHRDYLLSGTVIELSLYSDRLEIISPGRLPNGITPARMQTGCRAARNQLLKDVLRDYGYLEHMGMGVPRKIIRGMQHHNGTIPEFIEQDEQLTVRLWK